MTDLQIVVLRNQLDEPIQRAFAFLFGELVDLGDVMPDTEDGLPPCDWVCTNDRVCCHELSTDVLWRATGLAIQFEAVFFGGSAEAGLRVCCCELVEKFLVRFRKPVVKLVA